MARRQSSEGGERGEARSDDLKHGGTGGGSNNKVSGERQTAQLAVEDKYERM